MNKSRLLYPHGIVVVLLSVNEKFSKIRAARAASLSQSYDCFVTFVAVAVFVSYTPQCVGRNTYQNSH